MHALACGQRFYLVVRVRVLVVGDDPLARAGLANALTEIEIVAQIAPDDSVISAYRAYAPNAVLWDLGWGLETSGTSSTILRSFSRGTLFALTPKDR